MRALVSEDHTYYCARHVVIYQVYSIQYAVYNPSNVRKMSIMSVSKCVTYNGRQFFPLSLNFLLDINNYYLLFSFYYMVSPCKVCLMGIFVLNHIIFPVLVTCPWIKSSLPTLLEQQNWFSWLNSKIGTGAYSTGTSACFGHLNLP